MFTVHKAPMQWVNLHRKQDVDHLGLNVTVPRNVNTVRWLSVDGCGCRLLKLLTVTTVATPRASESQLGALRVVRGYRSSV